MSVLRTNGPLVHIFIENCYYFGSSAEVERKKREFHIAQEDLAEAARRKKEREEERKEDIRKVGKGTICFAYAKYRLFMQLFIIVI